MDLPRNSGVPRAPPEPENDDLSSNNHLIMKKTQKKYPKFILIRGGQRSSLRPKHFFDLFMISWFFDHKSTFPGSGGALGTLELRGGSISSYGLL